MAILLVSSPGGHLRQMRSLAPRFDLPGPVIWASSPSSQSESLLAEEIVVGLPTTPSRDLVGATKVYRIARRELQSRDIDTVISTGALPAIPFLLEARRRGLACHYIESAARSLGPSLTGRLAARIPDVHLYSQYPGWAHDGWNFAGSVLDEFRPSDAAARGTVEIKRVVVTVGVESFDFRRALEALIAVIPPSANVLWQTGHTDPSGLPIEASPWIPATELEHAMSQADVVVSHAGVGSALTALSAGKCPILLPRLKQFREHVDDHQIQIAEELDSQDLAVNCPVSELTLEALTVASTLRVSRVPAPTFHLEDAR